MVDFKSLFVIALAGFSALASAEHDGKGKGKGRGKGKGPKNFIMVCAGRSLSTPPVCVRAC